MIDEKDVLVQIGAALDVEPSSAFAAGVRQRIARDAERRPPWVLFLSAGLTAAVLVVVAVVVSDRRTNTAAPAAATASNRQAPALSWASSGVDRAKKTDVTETTPSESGQQIPHPRASAPAEVLVPPGQAEAIRILVAGLNDGTIDPGSLGSPPPDASVPLSPPAEITIAPIVLPPFDPTVSGSGTGSGGDIN